MAIKWYNIVMVLFRNIAVFILAVIIATAGIPVRSVLVQPVKVECQDMAMKDCPDCPKKASQQEQHKDKCPGDIGCAACCASGGMNLATSVESPYLPVTETAAFVGFTNEAIIHSHNQTPEHPPKTLS
jgi:hypothetical protein